MIQKETATQTSARAETAWKIRQITAGILFFLLLWHSPLHSSEISWILYLTSWIILLHLLLGIRIFVKVLHALSPPHQWLDLLAGLLLTGAMLSQAEPARWSLLFSGFFALAMLKYHLIRKQPNCPPLHRQYAELKIKAELPSVPFFLSAAALFSLLSDSSTWVRLVEAGLLAGAAGFGIWIILIKKAYQNLESGCMD